MPEEHEADDSQQQWEWGGATDWTKSLLDIGSDALNSISGGPEAADGTFPLPRPGSSSRAEHEPQTPSHAPADSYQVGSIHVRTHGPHCKAVQAGSSTSSVQWFPTQAIADLLATNMVPEQSGMQSAILNNPLIIFYMRGVMSLPLCAGGGSAAV